MFEEYESFIKSEEEGTVYYYSKDGGVWVSTMESRRQAEVRQLERARQKRLKEIEEILNA